MLGYWVKGLDSEGRLGFWVKGLVTWRGVAASIGLSLSLSAAIISESIRNPPHPAPSAAAGSVTGPRGARSDPSPGMARVPSLRPSGISSSSSQSCEKEKTAAS